MNFELFSQGKKERNWIHEKKENFLHFVNLFFSLEKRKKKPRHKVTPGWASYLRNALQDSPTFFFPQDQSGDLETLQTSI